MLLTGISLVASTAVIFLVSYLSATRRKWEPGLLMTQGWTWAKYSKFVLAYFLTTALIAVAFSAFVALATGHFLLYQLQVTGNILTIRTTIDPLYLISALPLGLLVSAAASLVSVSRMKRLGLDNILRDY